MDTESEVSPKGSEVSPKGWDVTRLTHSVEKTAWGPGPWEDEPDEVAWQSNGMACLILRAKTSGTFCGYVGVTQRHAYYCRPYQELDVSCHGGLTFAGFIGCGCSALWWLGFDTAHWRDYMPALMVEGGLLRSTALLGDNRYRTIGYVRAEVEAMAFALARIQRRRRLRKRAEKKRLSRLRAAARRDLVRLAGSPWRCGLEASVRAMNARAILRGLSAYRLPPPSVPRSLREYFSPAPRDLVRPPT